MSWTQIDALPEWNVTDQELLKRLSYHLLENGAADAGISPTTSMFTTQQWLNVLNHAQQKFLRDTAAVVIRASQPVTPQVPRYPLPPNWIHTRRLSFDATVPVIPAPQPIQE